MAAACNNPEFAKKNDISKSVACDFHNADKKSGNFINKESENDAVDIIAVDVPLLIRIMELSREDIKSDEMLHKVAQEIINLSKTKDFLSMEDYANIVSPLTSAAKGDIIIDNISEQIVQRSNDIRKR